METLAPDLPLGSLVRFHRKRARVSQIELAAMAGVSRKVVQDIEVGRETASWKNVLGVLEVLNIRLQPEGPLVAEWRSAMTAGLDDAREVEP